MSIEQNSFVFTGFVESLHFLNRNNSMNVLGVCLRFEIPGFLARG
jgi:hypothetical protein